MVEFVLNFNTHAPLQHDLDVIDITMEFTTKNLSYTIINQ